MKKKYKLDKEEREHLNFVEKGQWKSVKDKEAKVKRYALYAKNTIKKNKRISIRMSNQDYLGIQVKAMEEGLPYQTLITSIVHKYVLGTLKPRKGIDRKTLEKAKN
ncbi:MAG: antitoxin [Candidatus Omnitrophota bacterium]